MSIKVKILKEDVKRIDESLVDLLADGAMLAARFFLRELAAPKLRFRFNSIKLPLVNTLSASCYWVRCSEA